MSDTTYGHDEFEADAHTLFEDIGAEGHGYDARTGEWSTVPIEKAHARMVAYTHDLEARTLPTRIGV